MRYEKEKTSYNSIQASIEEWRHHREYGGRSWSSWNEYPIMFSFIHVYQIDNVIECGTCGGGSALAYAFALDQREAGVVHTWDVRNKTKVYDKHVCSQRVVFHNESFIDNAGPVIDTVEGKRLFFVDGMHTFEAVKADVLLVLGHARPGDMLVCHDVNHVHREVAKEVVDAIDSALEESSCTGCAVCKRYTIPTRGGFSVIEF